jgi:hypothetical protein
VVIDVDFGYQNRTRLVAAKLIFNAGRPEADVFLASSKSSKDIHSFLGENDTQLLAGVFVCWVKAAETRRLLG